MPQRAWNAKRERQYEHIKESLEERGRSEDTAEEIAARTVNKERARAGEARTAAAPPSRTSRRVGAAVSAPTPDPVGGRSSSSTTRRRTAASRVGRR